MQHSFTDRGSNFSYFRLKTFKTIKFLDLDTSSHLSLFAFGSYFANIKCFYGIKNKMSDVVTIKGKIKDTLEAIVQDDGTRKIVVVYNYPESKPAGYPYAWIDYKGDVSEVHSNLDDMIEYTFEVNLVQEKIEDFKGRADAEATAEAMAYAISEAFRADNDLGLGDVIRVLPIETIKSYVDGTTRIMLKTILKVQTLEQVTV